MCALYGVYLSTLSYIFIDSLTEGLARVWNTNTKIFIQNCIWSWKFFLFDWHMQSAYFCLRNVAVSTTSNSVGQSYCQAQCYR
jgi:hypothetical protein